MFARRNIVSSVRHVWVMAVQMCDTFLSSPRSGCAGALTMTPCRRQYRVFWGFYAVYVGIWRSISLKASVNRSLHSNKERQLWFHGTYRSHLVLKNIYVTRRRDAREREQIATSPCEVTFAGDVFCPTHDVSRPFSLPFKQTPRQMLTTSRGHGGCKRE